MRDESRLPKWAQSELQRLRSNLDSAKRKLDEVAGIDAGRPSEVRVQDYEAERKGWFRYLPVGSRIAFTLGEAEITMYVVVDESRPYIRAMVSGRLTRHIAVTGESGNVINISASRERAAS